MSVQFEVFLLNLVFSFVAMLRCSPPTTTDTRSTIIYRKPQHCQILPPICFLSTYYDIESKDLPSVATQSCFQGKWEIQFLKVIIIRVRSKTPCPIRALNRALSFSNRGHIVQTDGDLCSSKQQSLPHIYSDRKLYQRDPN